MALTPMMKHAIAEEAAVAVTRSLRTVAWHSSYPGTPIVRPSETHGPPVSDTMLAFTAKMYAIVMKVAVPARNSVHCKQGTHGEDEAKDRMVHIWKSRVILSLPANFNQVSFRRS